MIELAGVFRFWRTVALALVTVVIVCATGCDSGSSKRASQYQVLVGTWEPNTLYVDGVNLTSRLERRYDSFRLTFGEDALYRLRGAMGTDTLRVEGPVTMVTGNVLRMSQGFGEPVVWEVDFGEFSDRVYLRLADRRDVGSGAFLRTILPDGESWGDAQRVELELDLMRE